MLWYRPYGKMNNYESQNKFSKNDKKKKADPAARLGSKGDEYARDAELWHLPLEVGFQRCHRGASKSITMLSSKVVKNVKESSFGRRWCYGRSILRWAKLINACFDDADDQHKHLGKTKESSYCSPPNFS